MRQPAAIRPDNTRFFDGGDDQHPPDPGKAASYEFVRVDAEGRERFRALRRIGYRTREIEGRPHWTFIVPRDLDTWTTDFASVPAVFGWLVPKSGNHLPAALIHDALVVRPPNVIGPLVTRDEADLVFKEAMADLGTGLVRRWLIWTAVTLATTLRRQVGPEGSKARTYYFAVAVATLALTGWLGIQATLDVLNLAVASPLTIELPWMRSEVFWTDIVQGAAGAVVIPAVAGLLWGRFWRAGVIAGVALAFLMHVTVIIVALTGAYWLLEWLGTFRRGRVLLWVLIGLGALAVLIFVRSVS